MNFPRPPTPFISSRVAGCLLFLHSPCVRIDLFLFAHSFVFIVFIVFAVVIVFDTMSVSGACSKCPTEPCPNLDVTLELLHEKKETGQIEWEGDFCVRFCDPHRGSCSMEYKLAEKEDYLPLATKLVQKLRGCNYLFSRALLFNPRKETNSESKRIHVKRGFCDVQRNFLSFLSEAEVKPNYIRIMQRKMEFREEDVALFQWGLGNFVGITLDFHAPQPLENLRYYVQALPKVELGLFCWKLEISVFRNDSCTLCTEIRYKLGSHEEVFRMATRFLQMVREGEGKPVTYNRSNGNTIFTKFVNEYETKPEYIRLDGRAPSEMDIALAKIAIENSAELIFKTTKQAPFDLLREIVEKYINGESLSKGCFEWQLQEGPLDFARIIEGAKVVHQTETRSSWNHAYLQRGAKDPLFRVVKGVAVYGDSSGPRACHFLKWGPATQFK